FLAAGVSRRTGLQILVEGSPGKRLPAPTETALYRIVQEALTNVTKHAQATRVTIRFVRDGRVLRCVVRDNGTGFDVLAVQARRGARGLGLIGIQERLNAVRGTLNVISTPGGGAELVHSVLEALQAGVKGYVVKTQASADLIRAIHEVLRGMMYLSPGVSQAVVEAYLAKSELPVDPLTPREREVLQLVAEGKSTKEIAQLLGISFKTAESHRTRIMKKTSIHETAGLVRYAVRRGLIQP